MKSASSTYMHALGIINVNLFFNCQARSFLIHFCFFNNSRVMNEIIADQILWFTFYYIYRGHHFLLYLQGTSLTKVSARGSMHCWRDIVSSMVKLFLKLSKALILSKALVKIRDFWIIFLACSIAYALVVLSQVS